MAAHAQVMLEDFTTGRGEQFVFAQRVVIGFRLRLCPAKAAIGRRTATGEQALPPVRWREQRIFCGGQRRVSAKESLNPSTIAVAGVDIDGQWLRNQQPPARQKWQLAHPSPRAASSWKRSLEPSWEPRLTVRPSLLRRSSIGRHGRFPPERTLPSMQLTASLIRPCRQHRRGNIICGGSLLRGIEPASGFAAGNSPYATSVVEDRSKPIHRQRYVAGRNEHEAAF